MARSDRPHDRHRARPARSRRRIVAGHSAGVAAVRRLVLVLRIWLPSVRLTPPVHPLRSMWVERALLGERLEFIPASITQVEWF